MKKIIVLKVAKVPVISETKQNTTSQIFHESKEMPSSSKKASLKERTNNFSKSFFLMLNHKSWMKEVLVWLAYNWGVLLKPSVFFKRRCLDFIILFSQTIVRFDVTILSFDFVLLQNHLQLFYSKILPIIITFTASAIVVPPSLSIILNFYTAVAADSLWFWFDSIRN